MAVKLVPYVHVRTFLVTVFGLLPVTKGNGGNYYKLSAARTPNAGILAGAGFPMQMSKSGYPGVIPPRRKGNRREKLALGGQYLRFGPGSTGKARRLFEATFELAAAGGGFFRRIKAPSEIHKPSLELAGAHIFRAH